MEKRISEKNLQAISQDLKRKKLQKENERLNSVETMH